MNKFRNLALTIVTAIGVSNTIGYSYLNKNQMNDNNETAESVVTSAFQESFDNSDISEKDNISENNENKEKAEITIEKKTDDVKKPKITESIPTAGIAVTAESKIENNTSDIEKTKVDADKLYSIRNIKSNLKYDSSRLKYQYWTLDYNNDNVYYTDSDVVYKINLSSYESEIIADTTEVYSNYIGVSQLFYNNFTGDTYGVINSSICNLVTGKVYSGEYHGGPLRFVDNDLIIEIDDYYSAISGREMKLTEDSVVLNKSGYISVCDDRVTYIQPLIYNDCYYWIMRPHDYEFQLCFTLQSVKENEDDLLAPLEEFDAVACTVSNNDVYFIMSDYSIYKLNMEQVIEKQNAPVTTTPEKNIFTDKSEKEESDSVKKYCSLYLDGSKIKQTGKTNLNSVNSFYIRNNGDVVVFDTFDSTIKVIEKN